MQHPQQPPAVGAAAACIALEVDEDADLGTPGDEEIAAALHLVQCAVEPGAVVGSFTAAQGDAPQQLAARKAAPYGPRVRLVRQAYHAPLGATAGFDLVLCSYALSMFNPGFEAAIAAAERDLVPGGRFALVDFHATQVRGFARWMGVNHVRMDGQLRPILRRTFTPAIDELRNAYGGVWEYLIYVGRR